MNSIFKKAIAVATTTALVATMAVGTLVSVTTVKADSEINLKPWNVFQCGSAISDVNGETWNQGIFSSFATSEGETMGRLAPEGGERTVFTTKVATGWSAGIENNGQDKDWVNDRINPWQCRVEMKGIEVIPGHMYTLSFTAKASKVKYAYIAGGVTFDDGNAGTIFEGNPDFSPFIVIRQAEQTYSFDFTNWVSAKKFDFNMMLGAFNSTNDFDGTSLIEKGLTEPEAYWAGTIDVSNFKIVDRGQDPNFVPDPPKPTVPVVDPTTPSQGNQTVTPKPTTPTKPVVQAKKLAKVKKLKAKNNKKGTVKITWKKVAKAKKYQIKVGKKTYTAKKAKLTVKKLKKGKKYTIKVRATAAGYKAGAWAKKTVKIKK